MKIDYQYVLDNAADGVLVADVRSKKIIYANKKMCEYTGYSMEELLAMSVKDIHPKKDLPAILDQLKKEAKGELPLAKDISVIRKDGSIILFDISGMGMHEGKDFFTVGFFRDITNRKKTEDDLKVNQDYMQAIFNSLHVGMFLVDPKTHLIVDINPEGVKMFGAPKEQIVGKLCHNYICPAEYGKCPISDLGQEVDNSEKYLVHSDGTRTPILKTVTPITLNGRDLFLESFVDISARKKAENLLFATLKKQEIITGSAKDAIIMMDSEGTVSFWNRAATEMFGYSVAEIIGKDLHEMLAPKEFHKDYHEHYPHFQETGEGSAIGKTIELIGKRKNGEEFPMELSLSAVMDEGKWTSIGIVRDITERKRIDEEREKLHKDLEQKIEDLELFQRVTMGRENRVIELKEEIENLKKQLMTRR